MPDGLQMGSAPAANKAHCQEHDKTRKTLVGDGDFDALFSSCVMVPDAAVFLTVVGSERFCTSFSNRPWEIEDR